MATASIDDRVNRLMRWDLRLIINGQEFQTRPPTLGVLATIESAGRGDRGVSLRQLMAAVESLFHIVPNMNELAPDALKAIVDEVMAYWQARSKNGATPSSSPGATADEERPAADVLGTAATERRTSTSGA